MKRLTPLLFALFLTGCALIARAPHVAVGEIALIGVDPAGVKLEIQLLVSNPNSFSIALTRYSYDIRVASLPFARGEGTATTAFPPHAATQLRLPVKISFAELWEILKTRPDLAALPYRLTCHLELETPLGKKSAPIEKTGTFAVPQKYRSLFGSR